MTSRELLDAVIGAALRSDHEAVSNTLASEVRYWDALAGTVAGAPEAARAFIAALRNTGATRTSAAVHVRTGDDAAAVAEIETGPAHVAVVGFVAPDGLKLTEVRCYLDPADVVS